MENLALKVRISVLWLFYAVTWPVAMLLFLLGPGGIEQVMSGEVEGTQITTGFLLFMSLFWLIPLIMAFLSVTLRDAANRWANLILGIVVAAFEVLHMLGHLLQGQLTSLHLVSSVASIVVPALIAWYAWKWRKAEA